MKKLSSVILVFVVALALGVVMAACSSSNSNDPKARVDKALDSANIKGVKTSFDKDANVIHLEGTVDNAQTKQRAEEVATGAVGTSGKVLDELKVEGMDDKTASDQDSVIRDRLKDEVSKDQVLQDRDINFDVNNGVVTVKGNVRTAQEKARVSQMVKAIPGVKETANELDIKPKNLPDRNEPKH